MPVSRSSKSGKNKTKAKKKRPFLGTGLAEMAAQILEKSKKKKDKRLKEITGK